MSLQPTGMSTRRRSSEYTVFQSAMTWRAMCRSGDTSLGEAIMIFKTLAS